jgi:O-ureido-D-serine cyclo-ligase
MLLHMPRVALVSSANAVALDEDMGPLSEALRAAGAEVSATVWDDPGVRWDAFDLAVVRSTWDYVPRRDEFLRWAARTGERTRLRNAESVLRWNTDKHYLTELARRGVPVVRTHWVEHGGPITIPFDGPVVLKPAVSAGARDTARYAAGDPEAVTHARRLADAGRGVMVQPYLANIDVAGETALVYIAGAYSHAFRKGPLLRASPDFVHGLFVREDIGARQPSTMERAVAERVLDALPFRRHSLLYARVDLVPDDDHAPVLLELELTEPSLYFAIAPGSAERMARAILESCAD